MTVSYQVGLDVCDPSSAGDFSGLTIMVNTINSADATMGAGIAKDFKNRWPDVMPPYMALSSGRHLYGGDLRVLMDKPDLQILGMVTKESTRSLSKDIWVGAGLLRLAKHLQSVTSEGKNVRVLLPKPGCGNGGLDFAVVNRMIRSILSDTSAEIIVSVSSEAEAAMISKRDWPVTFAGVGSRKSSPNDDAKMSEIALIGAAGGMRLRTGEATGSDAAFYSGYRTWLDHPKRVENSSAAEIFLSDRTERPDGVPYKRWSAMLGVAAAFNPNAIPLGITDEVIEGRKEPEANARLMARNGHQVFGKDFTQISDAVICFTPGGNGEGGTGQAIRLAKAAGIGVFDIGSPDLRNVPAKEVLKMAFDSAKARERSVKADPVMRENVIRTPVVTSRQVSQDEVGDDIDFIDREDHGVDDDGNENYLDEDGNLIDTAMFGGPDTFKALNAHDEKRKERRAEILEIYQSGKEKEAVFEAIRDGAKSYGAVSLISGIPASASLRLVQSMLAEGELVMGENGMFTPRDPAPSPETSAP